VEQISARTQDVLPLEEISVPCFYPHTGSLSLSRSLSCENMSFSARMRALRDQISLEVNPDTFSEVVGVRGCTRKRTLT
jgi:hypothetical protein